MRIAFVQHWEGHKIGEEIDVHPTQAMYLSRAGLARFVDLPGKVTASDLFRPVAENAMAGPAAENTDARPRFVPPASGGYQPDGPATAPPLPRGGTGQSGRKRKRAKK